MITGRKVKMKLGLCIKRGCFRRATLEIEIPEINYKGHVCDKCFRKLQVMELFNLKEVFK